MTTAEVDAAEHIVIDDGLGRSSSSRSATLSRGAPSARTLKHVLQGLDLIALTLGWTGAYVLLLDARWALEPLQPAALPVVAVIISVAVMAVKRLWLARVCSVRSMELQRLGEMSVIALLLVLGLTAVTDYDAPDRFAFYGSGLSFALLVTVRGGYRAWLGGQRRRGLLTRRLLVVGVNSEAAALLRLMTDNPRAGFSIAGVWAPRTANDSAGIDAPWYGDVEDVAAAVTASNATGALVVASAFDTVELNSVLRRLLDAGCHVHLSSGLRGIAHARLLPLPLAREPLFYLERTALSRPQRLLKRALDLSISVVILAVAAPLLVAAAVAIKLEDGGPVLFRQRRVGRDGRTFVLLKLRTMVVDAELRRAELAGRNMRSGPLFKVVADPRITRVGGYLRALSIDELPQLLNVVRGDMSLIGPRPALPEEAAQFDDELRARARMMPGITGLWQVEARDDPSFDSYKRLDLFYVENWSVALDLSILLTTAAVVLPRGLRAFRSTAQAS